MLGDQSNTNSTNSSTGKHKIIDYYDSGCYNNILFSVANQSGSVRVGKSISKSLFLKFFNSEQATTIIFELIFLQNLITRNLKNS